MGPVGATGPIHKPNAVGLAPHRHSHETKAHGSHPPRPPRQCHPPGPSRPARAACSPNTAALALCPRTDVAQHLDDARGLVVVWARLRLRMRVLEMAHGVPELEAGLHPELLLERCNVTGVGACADP